MNITLVHLQVSRPLYDRHTLSCAVFLAMLALSAGSATHGLAQPNEAGGLEVTSIAFQGNKGLTTEELQSQMSTRETPGSFSKFLYHSISEALGRKEEYFDPVTLAADLDRLRQYYENRGFSEVKIDTSLVFSPVNESVDVTVIVTEGYRSIIDSLSYRGITGASEAVWSDIGVDRKIGTGDPFNVVLLEEEVERVLRILYDNGYPNARYVRDSSSARRFASSKNYTVVLTFSIGKRYLFGDVSVRQETDTLRGRFQRVDITDDIIFDYLDYKPGDFYSLARKVSSEGNLSRLGIFELRRFDMLVPPPDDSSIVVPSTIVLRPLDKHEVAPDVFISDEDGAFNIGTGIGYTNRNFFGGARRFTTRLRFRTQTLTQFPHYFAIGSSSVANLDLTFELLQPYVFSNKIKGTWSFSLIIDKQKPYRQNIIRNKFGFTGRFAGFTTGFLDWTLESATLRLNPNFQLDVNDAEVQRALRLLQEQQFNSILSFTLQRDKTNDLFTPSEGFIHSGTVEEAGVFPLGLRSLFGVYSPFTQFYRITLQGRWYTDLTTHRFGILGFKVKAGWEDKYGESRADTNRVIPQTNRFFAGGGNSVRGWASRGLIARGDPQLGGNILLESSIELRLNLLQGLRDGLFDKIWMVLFLDGGNVWQIVDQLQLKTVAIATGLGFRYDTLFGAFRVDWGLRVYDPSAPPGDEWITGRNFLKQTVATSVFHFGIGHAF